MKQVLIIFCMMASIYSCSSNKMNEPSEIGRTAFEVFKNIQGKDFDSFDKIFLQLSDLKYLINHNNVNDSLKRLFHDSVTFEKIKLKKEKLFNELKKEILDHNIICIKTKYIDFTYKFEKEDFIDMIKGAIYFSFEKEIFMIDYTAYKIDDYYKLADFSNIREKED